MKIRIFCTSVFLLTACLVLAQPAKLSFEVASVKASDPVLDGRFMISLGGDPGRIDWKGVPLRMIIAQAYEVKDFQVTGPDFLRSTRFDISAKFPEGVNRDHVPEMMRTLLEERFKIGVRRETKESATYALTVAKTGLKVKEAEEGASNSGQVRMGQGLIEASGVPMVQLSTMLARMLDRPVIDETGLKGAYNIKIEYSPDSAMGHGAGGGIAGPMGAGPNGPPPPDEGGASIFTALQEQCGLKLESKKAPVEQVIVDRIEKTPSAN